MSVIASTNIRYTGTQAGDEKEDVLDRLTEQSPWETPVLALVDRAERATDPLAHKWPLEAYYARPTATPSRIVGEGTDATYAVTETRPVWQNRTVILQEARAVSGSTQASMIHGVTNEYDHQVAVATKLVLRDFEWLLVNGAIDVDSLGPNTGSDGNKRKMGGLKDQIVNYANYAVVGSLTGGAIPTNASAGTVFNNADIEGNLETVADNGGNPSGSHLVIAKRNICRKIRDIYAPFSSTFSVWRRNFGNDTQTSIDLRLHQIETSSGILWLHASQDVPANEFLAFDPSLFQYVPYRDLAYTKLAKVGDSDGFLVLMEGTCRLLQPNSAWRVHTVP